MLRKILISLLAISFLFINIPYVFAATPYKTGGNDCTPSDQPNGLCVDTLSCQPSRSDPTRFLCQREKVGGDDCRPTDPNGYCATGLSCEPSKADPTRFLCQTGTSSAFGKIEPPQAIKNFLGTDTTGASGISKFLSNLITLLYSIASVVVILMFAWGAFDWIISSGEKEKVAGAQKRIFNALVGIVLLAVSFAIIKIFSIFTGFSFFYELPAADKCSGETFSKSTSNNKCMRWYSPVNSACKYILEEVPDRYCK